MKIAFVHDYIKEYGGAERVLEALHEVWPDAPVFTTVYLPKFLGPHRERFKTWKIKTSFFQNIPFKGKMISIFRIFAPVVFKSFDFSKFDIIVVSATGAYSPNVIDKKNAIQICYFHTPPRYLYGYATAREWKKNIVFRVLGGLANHFLRLTDYKSSENIDFAIANSEEVKARIKKFYKRDAVVIYPPVDVVPSSLASSVQLKRKKLNADELNVEYYLAGGRLARPKHVDLIIETCTKLNLSLKVFGKSFAGYGKELRLVAGSNIEFVGEISDEEKLELMGNAKAYIFASEDEDFGITPVEAMSVGTPVIAYRSGGVLETVIEGKTGVFFDELTMDNLSKAIKKIQNTKINPADCINQAQKFSKGRFKREIKDFVNLKIKSQKSKPHVKTQNF
ncbi:MAG: glycosyltransferase [Patescibacteria group bacterium]|nr:glycosyltransferase [Patescibacteria group bacterium]